MQLLTNGGNPEGLFRGAIMHSGSPLPVGDIEAQQEQYDAIVRSTGCAEAADTLQCLREVPADTLVAAGNSLPGLYGYLVRLIQGSTIGQ